MKITVVKGGDKYEVMRLEYYFIKVKNVSLKKEKMMVTKTLVCSICGREYTKAGMECEVTEDKVHKFVKVEDNLKRRCKDILVCEVCGMEAGSEIACPISKDKKHKFTKLIVLY